MGTISDATNRIDSLNEIGIDNFHPQREKNKKSIIFETDPIITVEKHVNKIDINDSL